MATNTTSSHHTDVFFTSLISDIKSYSGKDPLLPWLRGIKKMKETLPSNLLKEKLPRFLQKCAHTFESDRRYKNDLRYLRVWLQLMDYVDEPKLLLRTMELNHIGTRRSLFYQAYALYYEKMKKFEEAEKLYHLGAKNLAEPVAELQKSYEQFLQRMERHKHKILQRQEGRISKRPLYARKVEEHNENMNDIGDRHKDVLNENSQNVKPLMECNYRVSADSYKIDTRTNSSMKKELLEKIERKDLIRPLVNTGRDSKERRTFGGEDTVVVRFVDTAIVGRSEAKDACHHGLVDPTINLMEAMNAINSMFKEPIETAPIRRKSQKNQAKEQSPRSGFDVYIDDNMDNEAEPSYHNKAGNNTSMMQNGRSQMCSPQQEAFQIFVDDEEGDENDNLAQCESQSQGESSSSSTSHLTAFVFPCPKDLPSENSDDIDAEGSPRVTLREDTVVHRFVGSTILDEPAVENVWHHGLVDPTINLKEAMDDINNMFGKPIEFVRRKRPKSQSNKPLHGKQDGSSFSILPDEDFGHQISQANKPLHGKQDSGSFSILPDDDFEHQKSQANRQLHGKQEARSFSILQDNDIEQQNSQVPSKSARARAADLFEQTVFTKEAMDDINKMFAMPLDF